MLLSSVVVVVLVLVSALMNNFLVVRCTKRYTSSENCHASTEKRHASARTRIAESSTPHNYRIRIKISITIKTNVMQAFSRKVIELSVTGVYPHFYNIFDITRGDRWGF